jgi:hypothetical protein
MYKLGQRTVHLDGCVEVEAAYYSTPPGWTGRVVRVQWDDRHVRVLDQETGTLLREHLRQPRGRRSIPAEDRSPKTPPSVTALLIRAGTAGRNIGVFCQELHKTGGPESVRQIFGVLSLAKKHGPAATDDACKFALETQAVRYRFLRRYLERVSPLQLSLRQVDPLIRQLKAYRGVIARKTKENPE